MRLKATVLITAAAAALVGVAPAVAAKKTTIGSATLLDAEGAVRGQARLVDRGDRIEVELDVRGLPPGVHGVHLHAVGSCNAPDFTSAGPHLNPDGRMHGTLNPQGSHLGDLPNLTIGRGGKGSLKARLPGAPAQVWPALFDGDGTAIVVHATADDYRTDPSGDSGARIACGALTRIR
jgi:superoxide dismutase, Cu-Zn family